MTQNSWAEGYRATTVAERIFLTGPQEPYRYALVRDETGTELLYACRSHIPLMNGSWRKVYEEISDPAGEITRRVRDESTARAQASSPAATQGYDLHEGQLRIQLGGEILAVRLPRDAMTLRQP